MVKLIKPMRNKDQLFWMIIVILVIPFSSCKEDECDVCYLETTEVIELQTEFGNIYLQLFEETPFHYSNFDSLVRTQYYDSTEFHRCVDNFVIQVGSPTSKDNNRNND